MGELEQLAQKMTKETPSDYQRWKESLQFARSSLSVAVLDDRQFEKLALNSQSISAFNLLAKYLYQSAKTQPDSSRGVTALFQQVDDSIYSLKEWIEAIAFFHEEVEKRGQKTDFLTLLGYLRCCALSPENKTRKRSFCELISEMLDDYGFEAGLPKT